MIACGGNLQKSLSQNSPPVPLVRGRLRPLYLMAADTAANRAEPEIFHHKKRRPRQAPSKGRYQFVVLFFTLRGLSIRTKSIRINYATEAKIVTLVTLHNADTVRRPAALGVVIPATTAVDAAIATRSSSRVRCTPDRIIVIQVLTPFADIPVHVG